MSDKALQKKIAELEAQIKKLKKNNLGLVFEDKTEDVVEQWYQSWVDYIIGELNKRILNSRDRS